MTHDQAIRQDRTPGDVLAASQAIAEVLDHDLLLGDDVVDQQTEPLARDLDHQDQMIGDRPRF